MEDGVPMSIAGGYEVIDEEPASIATLTFNPITPSRGVQVCKDGNRSTGTLVDGLTIEGEVGDTVEWFYYASQGYSSVGGTTELTGEQTIDMTCPRNGYAIGWYNSSLPPYGGGNTLFTKNMCNNDHTDSYLPTVGSSVYTIVYDTLQEMDVVTEVGEVTDVYYTDGLITSIKTNVNNLVYIREPSSDKDTYIP